MKEINLHNYEEYALEFINHELNEKETEQFADFLAKHPKIADDFLLFDLNEEEILAPSPTFDKLKKDINEIDINEYNFEEFCIASIEGDLDARGEKALKQYIGNNTSRQREYDLFAQCQLPNEILVFPKKEALLVKQRKTLVPRKIINIGASIVAASIMAFIAFTIPTNKDNNEEIAMAPAVKTQAPKPQNTTPKEVTRVAPKATTKAPINKTEAPAKESIIEEKVLTTETSTKLQSVTLAKIESKKAHISTRAIEVNDLEIQTSDYKYDNYETLASSNSTLKDKTKKFLYSTILSKSVEGINKMTETELDYNIIEDEDGKPIKVIIRSRFGEINRTLAQR